MTYTKTTPKAIVQAWSEAVHSGRFDAARPLAREGLKFRGPLDTFSRVDDFLAALKQLGGIVKGWELETIIADGNQVALFYILKTVVADAPVAEWYTVEDGKIARSTPTSTLARLHRLRLLISQPPGHRRAR